MDRVSETIKSSANDADGFIKYVFNFDNDSKSQLLNMFQYAILAIIPILLILKLIKYIIPEEQEAKDSLELVGEVVGQLVVIIFSMWFFNRLIRYVPTYSKVDYPEFDPISFLIPFLIILSTMQTKYGAKLNILFDRVISYWNGNSPQREQQNNVRVMQPLSNGQSHQTSRADYLDTSVLPPPGQIPKMIPNDQHQQQQQLQHQQPQTNFNDMYQNNPTPMHGASTPGNNNFEPMAANDGGSSFSAW